METMNAVRATNAAAQAACDAWSAELERVYGRKAGDARYDQRGRATPALAELAAAYRLASIAYSDAWQDHLAAARAEPATN